MVYATISAKPGLVFVHSEVSKYIYIPQFEDISEFLGSLKNKKCHVTVYMDSLEGTKYLVSIPYSHFKNTYNLYDINYVIVDSTLGFFEKTVRQCMVFMYDE